MKEVKNVLPISEEILKEAESRSDTPQGGCYIPELLTEIYRLRSIINKMNNGKSYDEVFAMAARNEYHWYRKCQELEKKVKSRERAFDKEKMIREELIKIRTKLDKLLSD